MSSTKMVAICECNDSDCKKKILAQCPVVRMGKVGEGKAFEGNVVIPPNQCIGCGICAVKCSHGKVKMVVNEW